METTTSIFSDKIRRPLYTLLNLVFLAVSIVAAFLFLRGTFLLEGAVLNFQAPLIWIFEISKISSKNWVISILKLLVGIVYIMVLVFCCRDIFRIAKNCIKFMKKPDQLDLHAQRLIDQNFICANNVIFTLALFMIGMSFVYEVTFFSIKTWVYISIILFPFIKLVKDFLGNNDWIAFPKMVLSTVETTICTFIALIVLDMISTPVIQNFFRDIGKFRAYNPAMLLYSLNTHFIAPALTIALAVKAVAVLADTTSDWSTKHYRSVTLEFFRSMLIIALVSFALSSVSSALLISNFVEIYTDTVSILKYFLSYGSDLYLPITALAVAGHLAMRYVADEDSLNILLPKKYRPIVANEEAGPAEEDPQAVGKTDADASNEQYDFEYMPDS